MIEMWHVFVYEFKRNGRRTGYLFMTIGIPVIAVALFFAIQFFQNRTQNSGTSIQNNSSSNQGGGLFSGNNLPIGLVDESGLISANADVNPYKRLPDVQSANVALQNNVISGYYLIPADYVQSGHVELWLSQFS